jgi:NAD(P)-dependent dehydrogenase (short-subunit alcohol dehydrogenase family)
MFNNAGLGGAIGPIIETTDADWRRTFDILVGGVFLGTKHAARLMIAAGEGGAIVNTASVAGQSGGVGPHAYSAAKAAVISLTRTSAVELAPHLIRVNAICPGAVYTPLMHGGDLDDADRAISVVQPWPERGEPRHLADVVHFLATPASRFVTGQTITADGGMLAAGPRFTEAQHRNRITRDQVAGFTEGSTGRRHTIRWLKERPKD